MPFRAVILNGSEELKGDQEEVKICPDLFEAQKDVDRFNNFETKFVAAGDYDQALASQNACNLGALIHQFDRVISKIQYEASAFGHGTDWVNGHPIVRLYAEQIAWLSHVRNYSEASEYCEKRR
jgi:hypothetical protein